MTGFKFELDGRFKKQARGQIERFSFEVGILKDHRHKSPISARAARARAWRRNSKLTASGAKRLGSLKFFAGGLARKTGKESGQNVSEVSEHLRRHTGINFYNKPWKSKRNRELLHFIRTSMHLFTKGKPSDKKRLENSLQAVVRNPILRGDYGGNSFATIKAKGFDRFMIDTGQLFQSIKARVWVKNV